MNLMLDFTTIQTFKIPPTIAVLKETNEALILANESLSEKTDTLKKLLIISLVVTVIIGASYYRKTKLKNQKSKK